jgi:hypothetical protein
MRDRLHCFYVPSSFLLRDRPLFLLSFSLLSSLLIYDLQLFRFEVIGELGWNCGRDLDADASYLHLSGHLCDRLSARSAYCPVRP